MRLLLLAVLVLQTCSSRCGVLSGPPRRQAGAGPGPGAGVRSAGLGLGLGVPISPCPAVFRFERRGGGWAGVVTVPAPPTDMPLVLRVDLALRAALTTKYAGTLQLQEGRKALLARLAAGDRRPVRYTLRFPAGTPLPAVTRVHTMGKDLCRAPADPHPGLGLDPGVTTTISLEHSVRPERMDGAAPPANEQATAPRQGTVKLFLQTDGDAPAPVAASPASGDSAITNDDDDEVCGRPVHHRLLVAGGGASSPGDWPWLAAVFATTSLGLEFHCAGSLVSAGHVITAAHCVHRHSPESLLVFVGRHNIRKWTEPQSQAREVDVLHVHPDFQAVNYTADVAVLQLSERVAYDWFVRPVCIDWTGVDALEPVVGRVGTVVGWGRDEHDRQLSTEPRAARLPIVSQEACLRSRPEFLHVTSERTFCAGFRNGSGPCNGDSGSGLMLGAPAGPWSLRGVVSLSLMDSERHSCDLHHFVVFTDIAKFRPWLSSLVRAARRPPRPAAVATKHVEIQTDLDDQPIWDSDPLPN